MGFSGLGSADLNRSSVDPCQVLSKRSLHEELADAMSSRACLTLYESSCGRLLGASQDITILLDLHGRSCSRSLTIPHAKILWRNPGAILSVSFMIWPGPCEKILSLLKSSGMLILRTRGLIGRIGRWLGVITKQMRTKNTNKWKQMMRIY